MICTQMNIVETKNGYWNLDIGINGALTAKPEKTVFLKGIHNFCLVFHTPETTKVISNESKKGTGPEDSG